MCICGSMGCHSHAPYLSKSATQGWQRRDNPLVKSESLAKTNWRTGDHSNALFYNKNHKFAGKSPSPILDIALRSNTQTPPPEFCGSGPATAVVAAAGSAARAGSPGRRRRREPRNDPGASAPEGRAGSGGYDEGAAAVVASAALSTARAGPPGRRRRRKLRRRSGRVGSGRPGRIGWLR